MSDTDCGYTLVDPDGREEPCGKKTTGWRWYQDVSLEDCLEPACDWHSNAISEAIVDFERYGTNGPRTPGRMLRDVSDILGRPAAAPARKPPWFVVQHCCEAGAVAYPNPCPWHGAGPICGSSSPATGRRCILVGGHVIEHASGADDDEWWDPPKPGQVVKHQPADDNAVPAEHPSCSCADADRTYSELEAEYVKVCAERDLALWLHAESQWWLNQYMHDVTTWKREQDRLQASIDKALARHCKDADGSCRACGVDAYESPIPWPCETASILRGEDVQP